VYFVKKYVLCSNRKSSPGLFNGMDVPESAPVCGPSLAPPCAPPSPSSRHLRSSAHPKILLLDFFFFSEMCKQEPVPPEVLAESVSPRPRPCPALHDILSVLIPVDHAATAWARTRPAPSPFLVPLPIPTSRNHAPLFFPQSRLCITINHPHPTPRLQSISACAPHTHSSSANQQLLCTALHPGFPGSP
jgi:hypothetical protein